MSEYSVRAAHKTPTSFSDDIHTPFADIGMGSWTNDQFKEFFEAKTVLDIGSGFEGIARRLYGLFGESSNAPNVINLNPQFTDWYMVDERVNGELKSTPRFKQLDLESTIQQLLEESGEDPDGYFAQRIAVAGIVQQLPFAAETIDVVISTWGFPTSLYDCAGRDKDHIAGYREIQRVLKCGGIALLAPIRLSEFRHTHKMLSEALLNKPSYQTSKTGNRWGGQEFVLETTKS